MRSAIATVLLAAAWVASAEPFVYPETHWEKVADPATGGCSKNSRARNAGDAVLKKLSGAPALIE